MFSEKQKEFLKWTIYQIYPRSFCDSNGDGIGDIQGIISKIDYLKELGVNAVWLCPCYKSPNDDNGYDVSDYRDIMDEFGTMNDMKKLIFELHKRNIRLIMDLVPNHTSSAHRWFQESRKGKDNLYSNYYYWADQPLNDWSACFGGSAWTFDEVRGQYYLHSYAVTQPDLNWTEPKVVEEMKAVVDFWVSMGVDGFRIDVIDQISKDFENGRNCFGPRLHEFIHDLFGRPHLANLFTVGECWTNSIEEMEKHSGQERDELVTLFQFDHLECGRAEKFTPKKDSLKSLRDILVQWDTMCVEHDLLYVLFTDNHDQSRLLSRIGNDQELRYESASCIAAMVYSFCGIPFIYQGQEIGMPAAHYESIEDFRDIESLNLYKELCKTMPETQAMEKINFGSRDNPRRPFCWNDSPNGGFSTGTPWIPLHSRWQEINLKNDILSKKSVYQFYKELLALRKKHAAMITGKMEMLSRPEDNYFIVLREDEEERILVVCNFESSTKIQIDERGKVLLSNYGRKRISGQYHPFETAIFKLRKSGRKHHV